MFNESGAPIDKDFLEPFLEESEEILSQLEKITQEFGSPDDARLFEEFGQLVDRIMGAAYTLSLQTIGDLAKCGKELGYKGSQVDDAAKIFSLQSHLSQLVRALREIFKLMKAGKQPDFDEYSPLLSRLRKASDLLGDLRASVKF